MLSISNDRRFVAIIVIGSLAVAAAFQAYHYIYPSTVGRADAWAYQFYAFRFREYGLLYDFGTIRTYGYPLFLYPLTFISGFYNDRLSLVAGAVQYGLFLAATLWLVSLLTGLSRRLAVAALIGLLLNPLVISLVTDVLTEGLSIVLFVTLTALALSFSRAETWRRSVIALSAGSFVVAAALVVRPANIVVLIAWYLAVCLTVTLVPSRRWPRSHTIIAIVLSSIAAAAIVLGPQIAYNVSHYHEATFLPVCKLGGFQVASSVILWKYDTTIAGDSAASWNYLNPLFTGHMPAGGGWRWYREHPLAGAATLFAHVFNSFSVTSAFTYIRDLHPFYGLPLRLLYWSLNLAGLAAAARYAIFLLKGDSWLASATTALPIAFLTLTFLGIVALNSVSAVEVRFNVVPIAMLSVLAVALLLAVVRGNVRVEWRPVASFACILFACVAGSYAMDRLGTAGMGGRTSSFHPVADRCLSVAGDTGSNRQEIINEHEDMMRARRAR